MKKNSRTKVLDAIKSAGSGGIMNHELALMSGTKRYSARIYELKESGVPIRIKRVNSTDYRFYLDNNIDNLGVKKERKVIFDPVKNTASYIYV